MTGPALQTSTLPGEPHGPVGLGFPAQLQPATSRPNSRCIRQATRRPSARSAAASFRRDGPAHIRAQSNHIKRRTPFQRNARTRFSGRGACGSEHRDFSRSHDSRFIRRPVPSERPVPGGPVRPCPRSNHHSWRAPTRPRAAVQLRRPGPPSSLGHTPAGPTSTRSEAPQMQAPTLHLHPFLHHFSLHFRHDLRHTTHHSAVPTDLDPPPFDPHEAPDRITRCRPSQSLRPPVIPIFSFSLSEHPDVQVLKPTAGDS